MRSSYFSGLVMMLLGLGLCVASLYYLPICHGHEHEHMSCWYMTRATGLLGFVVGFSGAWMQFVRADRAWGFQGANVLLGIAVVGLATFIIGPCESPMMACHAVTGKVLVLWGVVISLVAVADMWRLSRH